MGYLKREEILKADDLETRDVDVPEWALDDGTCTVRVKALSGYQRDRYQASLLQFQKNGHRGKPELGNMTAKLVALAVVDEDGSPMFTELDVRNLGLKSSAALDRVADIAAEISGLVDDALEEATENLDETPNGDSGSSSPNG